LNDGDDKGFVYLKIFVPLHRDKKEIIMSNYALRINERIAPGKILIEYLKSLSEKCNYVDVIQENERPYNPEFVAKILRSDKSKGVKMKREDLWT